MLPVLKNAKHEAVLQAFLADKKRIGWRAYKKVYRNSSQHAAETAFSRLLKIAEFDARLQEITNAAAAVVGVSAARVFDELALLAFSNIKDYFNADGSFVGVDKLTREQAAALASLEFETRIEAPAGDAEQRQEAQAHGGSLRRAKAKPVRVQVIKFKLHDKRAALVDLGKHFGLFTPKAPGDGDKPKGDDRPMTDLDAARRVAFLLAGAAKAASKPTKGS